VFRIGWGFIGGAYARFSSFVRPPATVATYTGKLARGAAPRSIGHNPLGGWMVLVLLANLLFMVVSGLFAGEASETLGPLAHVAPLLGPEAWAELHEGAFDVLLVLITLHVFGVFVDRVITGDRLVMAMISGRKWVDPGTTVLANTRVGALRTIAMLAAAATAALVLASLPRSTPAVSGTAPNVTADYETGSYDDD
jgi:cytochrome b